jgi:parvulin-like peptidyl-prolyl isomerase
MSPTNDATVPPHLLNSGIDQEPEIPHTSRKAVPRKAIIPLIIGGVGLLAIGVLMGMLLSRRGDNPSLATVNGIPIDRQTYAHRCETVIANNAAIGPQVMRQMVQDELALQYAAKLGVTPSDELVNQKYDEASKSPDFATNLHKSLQTPDDVKHALKVSLAQNAVLTKGITVSDEEIQNFYKANIDPKNPRARYYTPDAVQIAAVISDKEVDINNALHDLASGASFAQVAQKYSKDKSSANAGVLPAIRRGTMNNQKFPGMEARLFSLSPGQQIDKLKVGNMFWLIRCIGRSQESTQPFDKVKEECRQGALLVKGINTNGKATQSDYQNFVRTAEIKAVQPQYADAVNLTGK